MVTEATPQTVEVGVVQGVQPPLGGVPVSPDTGQAVQQEGPRAAMPPTAQPTAPPVSAPSFITELQTRLQQELRLRQEQDAQELRQREAQVVAQEDLQTLASYQAQLAKQIEEQFGLSPEQAAPLANQQAQAIFQSYQHTRRAQENAGNASAKVQVATILSQRYQVPMLSLMGYGNATAMERAAQGIAQQSRTDARLAALEKENAELKKGRIPAQSFSQGVTEGSGATATPDNIDALYLKDPDRYGPAYRKFLASR